MAYTSGLLRRAGCRTEMYYVEKSRFFDEFCRSFDQVSQLTDVGEFSSADLITIHKISDGRLLRQLLELSDRTLLVVHDHDIYCPGHLKYYPFKCRNCFHAYHTLPCALCASMIPGEQRREKGKIRYLAELLFKFRRRLGIYRKFPHIAVLSEYMRNNLIKNRFPASSVRVIHPALALPDVDPSDRQYNEVPNIVFVGPLVRGKGVETFLRMAALLRHNFTAQIIGEGDDRRRLEDMCRELGLDDRIEFTGWKCSPEEFYAKADFAVYPFHWQEPFGLVGLEATAYGIPVVAFDLGGSSEWLKNGVNGILITPGNLKALAAAVNRLLVSPEERKRLGANGRELAAKHFSEEELIKQYAQLLNLPSGRK